MLGGPLAGLAAEKASAILLGKEVAEQAELERALATASPSMLMQLKEAGLALQRSLIEAGVEEERIAALDRQNARSREIALKDHIPGFLAVTVVAGFFAVLAVMLLRQVPEGTETEFSIMLGALAAMAAAVMNYYFGSSASSREKTRMLGQRSL